MPPGSITSVPHILQITEQNTGPSGKIANLIQHRFDMWQNGVNNYTKKGGVMYAYVCDGCNAQDTYMWVAAGADVTCATSVAVITASAQTSAKM
jgi:hypothetical protein